MLLIAAAVFGLDQWTKLWIRNHLALRETITPIPAMGNFFRIIHWKNTGIAFGLFQGNAEGSLNPAAKATRAEVATLLERMVKLIVT